MSFDSAYVVPIKRLPPESLAHIFCYLAHEIPLSLRGKLKKWDWITTTHICQYWRIVATENSSLWTTICIFPYVDAERTKKFLELSRQKDLQLHFYFSSEYSGDYDKAFDHLSLILQQIHRSSLLHLSLNKKCGLWTRIQNLLAQPAPRLKSLELTSLSGCKVVPLLSLPQSVTSLEKVTLSQFNISPYKSFFKGLRVLGLRRVEGLTSSDLLGILGACPQLEDLMLYYTNTIVTSWPSTISLPKLRNLILSENNYEICSTLLSCLSIPVSLNWDINFHMLNFSEAVDMGIFPTLLNPKVPHSVEHIVLDSFTKHLQIHTTSTPELDRCDSQYTIITTKLRFSQSYDRSFRSNPYQIYPRLAQVIRNTYWASAKTVHICVHPYKVFPKNVWKELLNAFSSLRHLDICLYFHQETLRSLRGLLEVLKERDVVSRNNFITCPELHQLSLRYVEPSEINKKIISELKACLKIRKEHGSALHHLLISSMDIIGEKIFPDEVSKLVDVISLKQEEKSSNRPTYYDDQKREYIFLKYQQN